MTATSKTQTKTIERLLPKDWQWVKFGAIIGETQPGFASGQRDPKGIIQLRMNNLDTRGNFVWDEFLRVPTEATAIVKYRLKPGDIVFNNTNSTELVGKSALFTGYDEPVTYSNHFTRLRTKSEIANPEFVTFWLISQWQAKTFANICNRWIGQSAVKTDKLFALEIPLPPLDEQRQIAKRLNGQMAAVESARKAAEEQLQAARRLPSAYLREVFEGSQAKNWKQKRLVEVGEIVSGITLGRKLFDIETRKVPYLRVANVKDGFLDLSDVYKIDATKADVEKCTLKYGDLLLTEGGDPDKLGRGTFWEEQIPECLHQNHIFRVRFDMRVFLPQFVAYQLGSSYGKSYFFAHAKQTTGIATINQKVLGNFPLLIPHFAEQKRIAETLKNKIGEAERLCASLESQLDKINRLPASLLREGFAGNL